MQVTIKQLADEAILIITLSGSVSKGVDSTIQDRVRVALAATEDRDYVIVDTKAMDTSFENIIAFLKLIQQGDPKTETRSRLDHFALPPIFVGSNQFVEMYIDRGLPKFFQTDDTPVFRTLDEALDYIRQHKRRTNTR